MEEIMSLTCDRLIKFDLVEERELSLPPHDKIIKFFELTQEIQSIDQFIKDSPSFPGSTEKIIRNELVSAIGATLAIEGTILDREEIEESLRKGAESEPLQRKEQEAQNSRNAYLFIKNVVDEAKKDGVEFIYNEHLIKNIHKKLTDEIRYMSNEPGQYRSNFNVKFGDPEKQSLCRTQDEIRDAMGKFIEWLNKKGTGFLSQSPFVKAIMAHYYLTEIHPFGDGNGRTARAVEALILYVHDMNTYCFWSLANFWSAHRDLYLNHLHNIRTTLDPIEFLLWGLEGYRDEIKRVKGKVLKKVKQLMLSDYVRYLYRSKAEQNIKINERIVNIVDLLIRWESMPFKKFSNTPELLALYKNSADSTRMRDFNKMEALGLIKFNKKENQEFVEINYQILEGLVYSV